MARILVIDDEVPIRRFLRIALEGSNYEVEEAERGRLGIEKAATFAPDALIIDLGLPDLDGKDVVRKIREWSEVPILVLSVRDGEIDKIGGVDELLFVAVRLDQPIELDDVVAGLGSRLRRESRGQVQVVDVINRHIDLVLRAPIRSHLVEPGVVGRDEMAPLQDRQLAPQVLTGGRGCRCRRRRGR